MYKRYRICPNITLLTGCTNACNRNYLLIQILQISSPDTTAQTSVQPRSRAPPDRLAATTQHPQSPLCCGRHGVWIVVIVVGLAFLCILVMASYIMWMPKYKVKIAISSQTHTCM